MRRRLVSAVVALLLIGLLPGPVAAAAPVATADPVTTDEDTPVVVIVSAQDATDLQGIDAFAVDTGPTSGSLSAFSSPDCVGDAPPICTATITYTPNLDANGPDSFTFTATDAGAETSSPVTVAITITAVDDAPTFVAGADQAVDEDGGALAVAGWASSIGPGGGSDESGQTVSFSAVAADAGLFSAGPAVSPAGTLTFTPAANAYGTTTVDVVAHDTGSAANGGVTASPTHTLTITIDPINDAPSLAGGADQMVDEDAGAQSIAAWATAISAGPANESGQAVTVTATPTNAGLFSAGPAVAGDGTLTFTPAPNANGSTSVEVVARDDGGTANGGTDAGPIQAFTITISPVNDPPSAFDDPLTVLEDAAATIADVLANDTIVPDAGETLTVTGTSVPGTGAAAVSGGGAAVTYAPTPDANGADSFTYTISDGSGGSDTATVNVTITPVNDAPSFTAGADQVVDEDAGSRSVPGWASALSAGPANEHAQVLSFEITSNSNAGLFDVPPAVAPDGTLSYTPADDANGTAVVAIRIRDDGGSANLGVDTGASVDLTITVRPVNDAPVFIDGGDVAAPEDSALQVVTGWASAISPGGGPDEIGQAVSFSITGNTDPTLFAVQPTVDAAGTLTFRPTPNRSGSATIEVSLSDDGGTADGGADTGPSTAFTISVEGANDPPIAANDVATVRLTGSTAIEVLANDSGGPNEPGDPYLISAVREGSRGILTITGGGTGLTYDPIGCTTGTDTFSYTLTDGAGLTDTATVLVTIAAPTTIPTADAPRPGFVTSTTIGSTIPVRLSWCALTSGTTIRSYRLVQSTNGGAYTTPISSTTATSSTRSLGVSPTTYVFKTRATDNRSRTSAYAAFPRFRVLRIQDSSTSISYSSGWSRSTISSHSGGSARFTSTAGRSATFVYTGRAFAIVGPRSSSRGSFHVYVNGVKVTSTAVSERASTTTYRRVLYTRSMPLGTHTVTIVAVGNGRVDLDAFLAIATP